SVLACRVAECPADRPFGLAFLAGLGRADVDADQPPRPVRLGQRYGQANPLHRLDGRIEIDENILVGHVGSPLRQADLTVTFGAFLSMTRIKWGAQWRASRQRAPGGSGQAGEPANRARCGTPSPRIGCRQTPVSRRAMRGEG